MTSILMEKTMLKNTLYALSISLSLAIAGPPQSAVAQTDDFVVTTLGTGTPTPVLDRMGPATLVEVGDKRLLFDAGRGVLIQLYRAGVPTGDLDALFVTHLHSDHVNGLPDLFLTGWLPGPFGKRRTPLDVFGPEGTIGLTEGLTQAYAWDITHRIEDQHLLSEGVQMNTTEISEGIVFDKDGVTVTAFMVNHGEKLKPAFGYRVDYDGRSVTISGDTTYDKHLIEAAKGTDLLIHATAAARLELLEASPVWGLILAHHTTPSDVGRVFTSVAPRLAVLYHVVLLTNGKVPPPKLEDIVAQVKSTYSGDLVAADDMMRFLITPDGIKVQK